MNSDCNPDKQEPLFYTGSQTKKLKSGILVRFHSLAEGSAGR
jgi:hypothetical protein